MSKIKLVVFDLDFTLWDAGGLWCDHTTPPFNKTHKGVFDAEGRHIYLYPDVLGIIQTCRDTDLPMALASRTSAPDWARQLIQLLGIEGVFVQEEIYPSSKVAHFNKLHQQLGIAYEDMVFFDDEMRNIDEVGKLGVKAIYVPDGLTWPLFEKGLSRR